MGYRSPGRSGSFDPLPKAAVFFLLLGQGESPPRGSVETRMSTGEANEGLLVSSV